ncbi:hypothetical protein FGB62_79g041 [Gracilaria domingensis]|nr:hypothetical protein FGB62_79g041 [Gracilaria domingensis]
MSSRNFEERSAALLAALTNVSTANGVMCRELEERTLERDQSLRQLKEEREEKDRIAMKVLEVEAQKEQAESEAKRWERHQEECMKELDALQTICHRLRKEVGHFQSENEHFKHIIANKTERLVAQLGTLGQLKSSMAEKETRIRWLENKLRSEKERVKERQRALDACEKFLHQIEQEHQAKLLRCFNEIQTLRAKLAGICREANHFLFTHPQLDIEISLILSKERAQCISPASTSSEEQN